MTLVLFLANLKDARMLVLSRKRDEKIDVSGPCVITVVDIRGDKVRLGIEAGPEVEIHRREITEKIAKKNSGKPQ